MMIKYLFLKNKEKHKGIKKYKIICQKLEDTSSISEDSQWFPSWQLLIF
jgi:hypothetical protein